MPVLENTRHELFAQNVAKGQTQAEAYENAGFKRNDGNASKLASRPEVEARINELKGFGVAKAIEAIGITEKNVASELAKLGFSNMLDYITIGRDGLPFVDMTAVTRDKGAAIQEVIVETKSDYEIGDDGKREAVPVRKVRFRLADKRAALVDLGKYLGMFTEQVEVTDKRSDSGKSSGDMLAEILDEMRRLGVTPEMLALPVPGPMIDVTPSGNGVANKPNGKNGTKH